MIPENILTDSKYQVEYEQVQDNETDPEKNS
jgi:hypothetical protein